MLRFWSRDSGVTCGSCKRTIRRMARLTAKPDTAIIKPIPLSIIEYGTLIPVFMFFFKKSEMLALLTDVRTIRTPSIITVKIHKLHWRYYIYIYIYSISAKIYITEWARFMQTFILAFVSSLLNHFSNHFYYIGQLLALLKRPKV